MKDQLKKLSSVSRRDFAAFAAQTFLGVGLLPVAGAAAFAADEQDAAISTASKGTAKNVIYLYMNGGMSHLDTLDPKPGAKTQGPVESIRTSASDVMISEYLPRLARHMDKAAIVRSLSSTQGAHERGQYLMRTSYTQRGTIRHPAMGAWVLRLSGRTNKSLPGNVRIGNDSRHPNAGFMEAQYAPLPIGDPTAGLQNSKLARGIAQQQFEKRVSLADQIDGEFRTRFDQKQVRSYTDAYDDAIRLMSSEELEAFNVYRESEAVRNSYGDNPFGQGCLLARRLVEKDVRFVEVSLGGWDTHQNNFIRVPERTEILDQALAALLGDLSDRGILKETLVVLATEFGRTPNINQNAGRDHYPKAFSGLLAGGGIRGGQVYGATDSTGAEVDDGLVEPPQSQRHDCLRLGPATKADRQVCLAPSVYGGGQGRSHHGTFLALAMIKRGAEAMKTVSHGAVATSHVMNKRKTQFSLRATVVLTAAIAVWVSIFRDMTPAEMAIFVGIALTAGLVGHVVYVLAALASDCHRHRVVALQRAPGSTIAATVRIGRALVATSGVSVRSLALPRGDGDACKSATRRRVHGGDCDGNVDL